MVESRKKKSTNHTVTYDTDVIAKNIWLTLLRDFRGSEGPNFCLKAEESFLQGVATYRNYTYPVLGIIPEKRFKCYKQMEGLLKKYRFSSDKFTDEELKIKSQQQFVDEQEFFSAPGRESYIGSLVMRRARKIARGILGRYDPNATVTLGKFGRKSSIGCPLSLAYIDHKLTDVGAFSGSSDCAKWFLDDVSNDPIMSELVKDLSEKEGFGEHFAHESLALVQVPKSWKTLRPITPLTLLALYYSYGVGDQVENRLKSIGLDISHLQSRHRKWVKRFSETKTHATVDLSSASQSLTCDVLNRVLPREWYNAMKKTFTHQFVVNGELHYAESVLPMGNGLTFPVETLVFYVILKAIAELSKVRGIISVYGDDLIYPCKLHRYVAWIFPKLRFRLNLDKTFVKAPFRESCGSDFYSGCDVRPSFLPVEGHKLTRTRYAIWLYKAYNALSRRWDELKIHYTLLLILKELACLGVPLFRVPPSFPDSAGIKVLSHEVIPCDTQILPWSPIIKKFIYGSQWYNFSFLSAQPNYRAVVTVLPYYWQALTKQDDAPEFDNFWDTKNQRFVSKPPLDWKKLERTRYVLKKGKRKRLVLVSYLPTSASRSGCKIKVVQNFSAESESMSDWF